MNEAARDPDRNRYFEDAERVASWVEERMDPRAVWLLGPFTRERLARGADMHVVVVSGTHDHIEFNHILPDFSPVGRRLEIGIFPAGYFGDMMAGRYTNPHFVYNAQKLLEYHALRDPEGILPGLEEKARALRPTMFLTGQYINLIKHGIAEAAKEREGGNHPRAVALARSTSAFALSTLLQAKYGLVPAKAVQTSAMAAGAADGAYREYVKVMLHAGDDGRERGEPIVSPDAVMADIGAFVGAIAGIVGIAPGLFGLDG